MLVRGWWICLYSSTSLMGCGESWSKIAWGRLSVDVPQQHVPHVACRVLSIIVGDGASLDLAMVEARRLFQHASRWHWSLAAATGFGE
jgi:hypothetical protein